eukprot:CAMPEP_0178929394 /NCGR_PEP_ID=MMETSP0786-20121207/20557_1 /TAXON_ID=186022 /ORGANISM="Thalassionema frauenfeldii, Strain CCMP 1798" /LENGTH=406 /DNA_ID=CAMNT_0020605609 /DNA_START=60 /DNA_END=1283 /DNA_ORIENTATION=-
MDVLKMNESAAISPSLKNKQLVQIRQSAATHDNDGVLKSPFEIELTSLLSQPSDQNSADTSPSKSQKDASEFSSVTKLIAAGTYAASSVAIQLVNKITLTTYEFPSANFVALAQCVFVVMALALAKHVFGYTHLYPPITWSSIKSMMPLPLIQVLNVGFGLFGTKAISIPMFTALRRTSVLLTLLSEIYILNLPTSKSVVYSIYLLLGGGIVAALHDLSFNLPGYLAVTASAVATTAYGVYSKMKLSGTSKKTKWEVLYINSLVSIPFFMMIISASISKAGDSNAWQNIFDFPQWTNPMFCICFALTSCLGFWLNFFILFNTQVNGPLSTTVVGTGKNVLTTYMGMMGVGGDYVFSWPNFLGLNLSMAGALWYSATKIREETKGTPSSMPPACSSNEEKDEEKGSR